MDTVPYILGIAHPPGLPFYTLLGWAFTHAVPLGSVAFRMSVLSALAMSAAAWFVFAIVRDWSDDVLAALGVAWIFACGYVAWSVGTRADVHACETALFAALAWMLLRWHAQNRERDLYASAVLFGLAAAMHPVGLFALPGVLVAILARASRVNVGALARAAVIAFSAGAIWFLYLPLRSAYVTSVGLDPLTSLGLSGNAFWDYDHPVVASNFIALVSGGDVALRGSFSGYASEIFIVALSAVVVAITMIRGRDLARALILCALCVLSAIFAAGFHGESDRARYFLPAILVGCVFVGVGLARLRATRAAAVATAAAALGIGWLVVSQTSFFAQPHDDRARRDVSEVLAHTPNDAVLIASWTLAPPLAYVDYVEHGTGGRAIVPAWYGEIATQLPGWVSRRRVYVVGIVQGKVAGYRLERLPTHTLLSFVVRN